MRDHITRKYGRCKIDGCTHLPAVDSLCTKHLGLKQHPDEKTEPPHRITPITFGDELTPTIHPYEFDYLEQLKNAHGNPVIFDPVKRWDDWEYIPDYTRHRRIQAKLKHMKMNRAPYRNRIAKAYIDNGNLFAEGKTTSRKRQSKNQSPPHATTSSVNTAKNTPI